MKEAKIKARLKIADLEGLSRVERNELSVWLKNAAKDIKEGKVKYAKKAQWTMYY